MAEDEPKRNRNYIRAWFGVIASAVLFWAWSRRPSQQHYNPNSAKSGDISAYDVVPPSIIPDTPNSAQNSYNEAEIIELAATLSDLSAQWYMSDMAHMAFWAGLVGITFIFLTLMETQNAAIEAKRATGAARETVEVTKRAAQAELRPYLVFESVEIDPRNMQSTEWYHITTAMMIKNIGNVPAKNVAIRTYHEARELYKGPVTLPDGPEWVAKALRGDRDSIEVGHLEAGGAEEYRLGTHAGLMLSLGHEGLKNDTDRVDPSMVIYMMVVLVYEGMFSTETYRTSTVVAIYKRDEAEDPPSYDQSRYRSYDTAS